MCKSEKINKLFTNNNDNFIYIISEIGINHNGSLSEALKLVEISKKIGADAVKFQKRNLNKIYSQAIIEDSNIAEWNFDYLIPLLKETELSEDDYYQIQERCKELDIDLIVTPFDEDSADFVHSLGIPAFKISSADMTNLNLITKCASFNLPLIISTGMWSEIDIQKCSLFYKKNNIKYAFLLCQSTYPAPYDSLNLNFIEKLKKCTDIVGYSGHERGFFIPIAAIALGCRIIEKHITFDRDQKGPDHKASLLPDEFAEMVKQIRFLEKAIGYNKEVNQAEKLNREVFAKSAVANFDIKKGHVLKSKHISFKSPGKGIYPHEISKYYGKKLAKDVFANRYISKADFEEELLIKNWKKFAFSKKWGIKCRFHDFKDYEILKPPVVEFHCSETDLESSFNEGSEFSELIVHAPEIFRRELIDLCSDDDNTVSKSIYILQKSIDKTIELNKLFSSSKPKLVMHLGGMSLYNVLKIDSDNLLENAIKNFKKLRFNKDEIEILPENLPPTPWYLGGEWHQYGFMTEKYMLEFCNFFGLGMTLDICHAFLYCNFANKKIVNFINKVSKIVRHIHISDAKGINGEGLQIHEGEIVFEKIFNVIEPLDFSWVPEIWRGHLYQGKGFYKALCSLEKYNYAL